MRNVRERPTNSSPLPSICVLELTNRCNMHCVMCPQRAQRCFGEMDAGMCEHIVSQLGEAVRLLQLYLVGEPTLHDRLIDLIAMCRRHTGAAIEISTNMLKLGDRDYTRALLESGVSRIICCIDGHSEQSYSKLRGEGNYGRVVEATRQLADMKVSMDVDVDIVVKCIESKFNQDELAAYVEYWRGVEGVATCTTWMNTWAGAMAGVTDMASRLCPNATKTRRPCAELWNKIVVRWNGDVALCCHDWNGMHLIGKATREDMMAIWDGEAMRSHRKAHIEGVYNGLCATCIEWSTPEECESDYGLPSEAIVEPKCEES